MKTSEGARVIGIYVALGDAFADAEILLVRSHPDTSVTVSCAGADETVLFAKLIEGIGKNIEIMHRLAAIVREQRERIA